MNYGPIIFLVAFFAMACSWFGLVLTPQVRVGHLQTTNTISAGVAYPVARPGLAREGLEVYRANGCAYCHSQQVLQSGTLCDVMLTDAGTNPAPVIAALQKIRPGLSEPEARQLILQLPKTVLSGVTRKEGDAAVKAFKASEAKADLWIVPVGPDISRGWGKRHSVAEDFLYDYPVILGEQRIGPDLAAVGLRLPDANWQLLHLYAPQEQVKGSTMPPYRFLFERRRIEGAGSPQALQLPAHLAPPIGYEIIPKTEAKALVAYLLSLRPTADLFDAPMTVPVTPSPGTNAPAGTTPEATNVVPANAAPAK